MEPEALRRLRLSGDYDLFFVIDGLPETPNKLQRKHWSYISKHAKQWHWLVREAVGDSRPDKPLRSATVTMVRHSRAQPDRDNLVASWKPVLDGLTQSGVIFDDAPEFIDFDGDGWVKKSTGHGHIEVYVKGRA
jgi:Holliday junction resolvase RusA-like endonuclease